MSENSSNQQGQFIVFKSGVFNNVNNNNSILIDRPDPNRTLCFDGANRSHRDIVLSSKIKDTLNIPIFLLTNESQTSRLAKRNRRYNIKKIPRPQNSWIIFRRNESLSPEFKGLKSSKISTIIQERWRNASNEVKEFYNALSVIALENHTKKYGEYKYQPRKPNPMKKRKSKKEKQTVREDNNVQLTPLMESPLVPPATLTPVTSKEDLSDLEFSNLQLTPETPLMASPLVPPATLIPVMSNLSGLDLEFLMNADFQFTPEPPLMELQTVSTPVTSEVNSENILDFLCNNDSFIYEQQSLMDSSPESAMNVENQYPTPVSLNSQISPVMSDDSFLSQIFPDQLALTTLFPSQETLIENNNFSTGGLSFPPLSAIKNNRSQIDDVPMMNVENHQFLSEDINVHYNYYQHDDICDEIESMHLNDTLLDPEMDFYINYENFLN